MSKKRKTRKDKQLADIRRVNPNPLGITPSENALHFSLTNISQKHEEIPQKTTPQATVIQNHAYVILDMRKTLIITALLIVLNSSVYYAIQHGLIHLTFLGL